MIDRKSAGALLATISLTMAAATAWAGTVTYTYDELGRVKTASYANGNQTIYNYDKAGNRTQYVVGSATDHAPVAVNDSVTTAVSTPVSFDPRTNDSDPDGNALTITTVSTPGHGTATITGGASVTYTPTTGYSGSDRFTYAISDGKGLGASAFVTVTVGTANHPPVANNDTVSTNLNTAGTWDLRANDTDADGDPLTITSVSAGAHGSVFNNGGTSVTYYPANGYVGSDSISYSISDGRGGSANATAAITVLGPPVANPDSITTTTGAPYGFDPRANDTDPNGFALTIASATAPFHGTVTTTATSLTYTSTASYTGGDTFNYTISDGHGQTATAAVTVTVQVGTPVANTDSLTATRIYNSFTRVYTHSGCMDVTTNDVANGPSLTVTSVTQGAYSPSLVTKTGNLVCYASTQGTGGWTDSFTYTVSNGTNSATGTVNVTATP